MPHTGAVGSYIALTYETYPTAPSASDIIGPLRALWSLFNPQLAGAGGGAGVGECVCPSGYTPSGNVCVKTGSPTIACLPSFAPPVFPGGSTPSPTPTPTPTTGTGSCSERCLAEIGLGTVGYLSPMYAACLVRCNQGEQTIQEKTKQGASALEQYAPLLIIVIGIILAIIALTLIVR